MSSKTEKADMAPRNRGSRLARRARSFKEDLIGKIIQMRSPSSTRSGSPYKIGPSPKGSIEEVGDRRNSIGEDVLAARALPVNDVESCRTEVMNALRYFGETVEKKAFEVLPWSVGAIIDAVLRIHTTFQNCLTNEQSSLLLSSNNQVYQSLSSLVHLVDVYLLHGESAFERDSIIETVKTVELAIKALMDLVVEKIKCKSLNNTSSSTPSTPLQNGSPSIPNDVIWSKSESSPVDLPLSSRELEILQATKFPSSDTLGHSLSSDSILESSLQDHLDMPPPKPPLPDRREPFRSNGRLLSMGSIPDMMPPALPPKRRHLNSCSLQSGHQFENFLCYPQLGAMYGEWNGKRAMSGSDWPSPMGHSPASASSLSVSGSSLDSTPNRSSDDLLNTYQTDLHSDYSAFGYRCQANHSVVWSETKTSMDTIDNVQKRLRDLSCFEVASGAAYCKSTVKSNQNVGPGGGLIISSTQTVSSMATASSSSCSGGAVLEHLLPFSTETPPAIPPKRRNPNQRTPSQYDNVPDFLNGEEKENSSPFTSPKLLKRNFIVAPSGETMIYSTACHSSSSSSGIADCEPPPLPPKKKHVMQYMQMFGSCVKTNANNYIHSVASYEFSHQEVSMSSNVPIPKAALNLGSLSNDCMFFLESMNGSIDSNHADTNDQLIIPPILPPKKSRGNTLPSKQLNSLKIEELQNSDNNQCQNDRIAIMQGHKENISVSPTETSQTRSPSSIRISSCDQPLSEISSTDSHINELQILDELDAKPFLIYTEEGEDGPDIRGGSVDALVIHATAISTKNDIRYQEAFMTTYRTFITPVELIHKLLYRYNKFGHAIDVTRQRVSRNAFSLLVRVVGDFSVWDVDDEILKILTEFVCKLISCGELHLARALRKKILEKWNAKQLASKSERSPLSSKGICTRQSILLDFKSEQLAEQMTLLDADLFQKIEIPEVLVWSRHQREDLSPNLTTFTEHFNKMSFWARSRILEKEDAKDRERCTLKFVKIMKHLRKMNNFNSYLAILSALDSAPIVRLEWPKHITESLKEYSELIDSSSSFRAYRQALAEAEVPCIPYIGLILQDLTFVHIGNSDFLPDGNVNFSKRWQQFNILDTIKRFRCQYNFKGSERIKAFFNNFDDCLCEEAMWQISETIKPRGMRKKVNQGGQ